MSFEATGAACARLVERAGHQGLMANRAKCVGLRGEGGRPARASIKDTPQRASIYRGQSVHFGRNAHPRRMWQAIGLVSGRPTEMSPELPGSESALLGCLLRSRMRAVIFRGRGRDPGCGLRSSGTPRRSRVRFSSIRGCPCDPGFGFRPSGGARAIPGSAFVRLAAPSGSRVRNPSIGEKRVRRMSIERRKTAPNGQEPNPEVLDGRNTHPGFLNGRGPNPDLLDGRTPNPKSPNGCKANPETLDERTTKRSQVRPVSIRSGQGSESVHRRKAGSALVHLRAKRGCGRFPGPA